MIALYFIVASILFIMLFYLSRKKNNINHEVTRPEFKSKNKWLYPEDNFGKLEKGVVH